MCDSFPGEGGGRGLYDMICEETPPCYFTVRQDIEVNYFRSI
jgi:hypothetical protein